MSISSEGNAYLQVRSQLSLLTKLLACSKQSSYFVGEPILETLQERPRFLQHCYENFSGAGLSSSMLVRTIHAFIFAQGIASFCHTQHILWLKLVQKFSSQVL